jgi:hypothetical protein
MALSDVEQKATSLLGQGGMQQPATAGPDQPEPILMAGLGDRLSLKAAQAMFGKGGGIMEKSRQRARDIKSGDYTVPKKGARTTDDIGNVELPEEVVPEAPAPVSPAIEEPTGAQKVADEVEASPLPDDTPERFIREDPYDNYINVDEDDIDIVMSAPERRDELLGSGMTDFNGNNLPDEVGIQERMEQISKLYPHDMEASRREKVTFAAARQVADMVGASPKKLQAVAKAVLERRRGEGINVEGLGMMESMLAARDLVVSEVKKLDALALSARGGEAVDIATFRYQLEFVANLQRQLRGATTEYARTLGGMRQQARPTSANPAVAQDAAAKNDMDLRSMLDGFGGAESVEEMARLYLQINDPSRKAAFVRGLSKTRKVGNAVYEVWQHALLTSPISQTKNIVSGIWTTFLAPNLELGGAVGIGAVRRAFTGATDGAKLTDLQSQLFGQLIAMREALIASGRAFREGAAPSRIESSEAGALAGTDGTKRIPAFSGEAFGEMGALGTAIDVMGNIFTAGRISFRTLEAGDTFFKVVARRGELYRSALVEGQARGKQGEDLFDFIAEYIIDPPAETLNKMELAAKYVTLQTELDEVGKSINKIAKLPILRYFVPFIKTPYNAAKYSFVERSPLGTVWGSTGEMMRAGGAQRDEAIARISLGTGIGMTTAGLVLTGDISGGGPANRSLRQAQIANGWQPYSVKVGGKWFSYAGFEPLSSIIGVWADASEILSSTEWEDDDLRPQDIVGAAIAATLYNVSNKTFMGNFATLAEVIQDPTRRTKSMMDNFAKTIVPRGVANLKRTGVPFLEDSETLKDIGIDLSGDPVIRDAQTFMEMMKAQIPSFSKDLMPSVDEWGRDKVRGVAGLTGERNLALGPDQLSPIYMRKESKDIVNDERIRLGGVYLRNDSKEMSIKGLNEPVLLDAEARYRRNQLKGKIGFGLVKTLVSSDEYKTLQKISERARAAGRPNEAIDEKMRRKIRNAYHDAEELADKKLMESKRFGPAIEKQMLRLQREQRDDERSGMQ